VTQSTMVQGDTLVLRRVFNASPERVYRAWTDPEQLIRWFSSNTRWRTPLVDVVPVQGGRHHIDMRHSDGDVFKLRGKYLEVIPNEKIVFTWVWLDDPMGTDADPESIVTVEFREVPGGTELTLTHEKLRNTDQQAQTSEGWEGCLTMLEGYLDTGAELLPLAQ